jgi:methanol---5-hydroxybenzimidazolylcobamide Co-methyltransferase
VQNVRLLAGPAPTCYMEQLVYDCRLMNRALAEGKVAALTLRRWLVESDAALDPQAWILAPENVIAISRAIVGAPSHYRAGVAAAHCTVELLRNAHAARQAKIVPREIRFLDTMLTQLDELPSDEAEFIAQQKPRVDATRYLPVEYGV